MKFLKHIYITALTTVVSTLSFGQEISKEVHVTSSFRPEIEQAEKISRMPEIDDTIAIKPKVNIEVVPSVVETEYQVREIKPAKIVSNPLEKLYNSYIKLGAGNHLTPLGEFSIHNLRSKNYSYGGYAYHKSSNKKEIELAEDIFVSNKFANNKIGGFGKLFMKDFTVEADAHFKSEMIHHYGLYTGGTITQNDIADETFYKQRFNDLGFAANLHSNGVDSSDFAYKIGLGANHFYDMHNNKEPHLNLNGEVSYMISSFLTGLRIDYHYYNFKPETGLSRLDNCWRINPYVKKRTKEWEFHLGAKAIHSRGDTTRWYFYPEGYLRISVLDDVIQGYLGVTGDLEVNNYAKLANENPYIKPTYDVRVPNTNHRLIGYAGVFGKFSSLGGYKLDVRFDAMENAAYYEVFEVGNSPNAIENQYILSTDDSDVITVSAEAYYKFLPNLNVLLDGKYSNYKLVTLAKPWHKPFFESNLSVEYSYNNKILTSFNMLYIGRRYSSIPQAGDYKVLNSIVDLNLGVEYKYSKVLTFFVDFHNLLGEKYEYWGQYPTQGFNFIVGATYKL